MRASHRSEKSLFAAWSWVLSLEQLMTFSLILEQLLKSSGHLALGFKELLSRLPSIDCWKLDGTQGEMKNLRPFKN